MKNIERKITLQVLGIIVVLYISSYLLVAVLEPARKNLKNQLIGSIVGSETYELCLESNRATIQKEVEEAKLKNRTERTVKIERKMQLIGFIAVVIQLLLAYLFSSFIVRYIIKKTKTS